MKNKFPITLEKHFGITVLRDDLLPGGTKSILLDGILDPDKKEYVYASPVYGGFQIALSLNRGKKATIFCAERKNLFPNTITCKKAGAKIVQVPHGYLSVVSARAREYVNKSPNTRQLIEFGAKSHAASNLMVDRVRQVIKAYGREPKHIFCAVGSGLLFESILAGTRTAKVFGVVVGKDYAVPLQYQKRGTIEKYPKSFEVAIKRDVPFPSMPNYDLKALEVCVGRQLMYDLEDVLFWNVL